VHARDWLKGVGGGWRQSSAGWFRVEFPGGDVTELLGWRHGIPSGDVGVRECGTDTFHMPERSGVTIVSLLAQWHCRSTATGKTTREHCMQFLK